MTEHADLIIKGLLIGVIVVAFVGQAWRLIWWSRRDRGGARTGNAGGIGATRVAVIHNGVEREFFYYIPETAGEGRPLLLGLHGGGAKALAFGRRTAMHRMAEKYGYTLVLPQSVTTGATAGGKLGELIRMDISEAEFVLAVLDRMQSIVAYDRSRVFAAGLSRGGMLAYELASREPDLLRAIAVVSGTNNSQTPGPGGDKVGLLHIHGTKDENVPWHGGMGANSRLGVNWQPVQLGIDFFTGTAARTVDHRVRPITEDTNLVVRSENAKSTVEICLVRNGGHAWPGSEPSSWQAKTNTYVSPHFDATEYIGQFFQRF